MEESKWGLVARRTNPGIRGLELSAPPPLDLQGGERGWRLITSLAIGDSTQSGLCNEASIKKPKGQGSESSWVGGRVEVLGGWCTW